MIKAILAASAIALCGCTTTPRGGTPATTTAEAAAKAARISVVAQAASYAGTRYWLSIHPSDTQYFVASEAALNVLLGKGNATPDEFAAALKGLPVKQLQSDEGTIAVGTAVVLYDALVAEYVDTGLDSNVYLFPIIAGVRDGIAKALLVP